jgi:hypothetical protein
MVIRDADALCASEIQSWTPEEKSLQARETVENLNAFDSNLIAYASDIKKTGDTVRSLLSLVSDPTDPKKWASAWLSGHYGDRLTIKDTRELFEALGRSLMSRSMYTTGRSRCRDSRTSATRYGTFEIARDRLTVVIAGNESYDSLSSSIYNLMRWDAWPTLENTWDMIPMSFVVDWFLPVSDLLKQMDAAIEAPYVNPVSQYIGTGSTVSIADLSGYSLSGSLSVRRYRRMPGSVLGDIRPFDVVASPPSFSVIHMTDALAMLVQTSKWHS